MQISKLEMRDAFITRLIEKARHDADIVFLTNDYGAPSLDRFREEMPAQFFNMAIAEQNMVSVAAGMAMEGKKVFVYSIASFLTLRCLEQVKIDICTMNLPVTLVGVGTAYAYSVDGPTHHATEDMAVTRCLSNLSIYSPSDSQAAQLLVDVALKQDGPKYFRFDKGKYPIHTSYELPGNGWALLRRGKGPCLVGTGTTTQRAVEVAEGLAGIGIDCSVVDLFRVKPLGRALIDLLHRQHHVVTIEEHALIGGIGSAIAELVVDNELTCLVKRAGIGDALLYAYGMRDALHEERGLSVKALTDLIVDWVDPGKGRIRLKGT
jgi:transketolase